MSEFRERLKQAAQWAGIGESQSDICRSLNLPRQTVNRWFMGGEANSEMAYRIARAWAVSAEWLQSGNGEMRPKPDELPDDEQELLKDYRKARAEARPLIRTVVRAMRKSVVTIAAAIPPLLAAPNDSRAGIEHNFYYAAESGRITHWLISAFYRMLGALRSAGIRTFRVANLSTTG